MFYLPLIVILLLEMLFDGVFVKVQDTGSHAGKR
jgi:hypothetical protein